MKNPSEATTVSNAAARDPLPILSATVKSTLALTLAASSAAMAADSRPNILFIYSDDHAYQAISAYHDPRNLIDTPNIDRIGREGERFDRCLVTNSLCGPARAALFTGKYSHLNGFYNNTNDKFDGSQVTFPKLLQKAGYQTAIVGKWHLGSDPTGFDYWKILIGQGIYYNPPMILNGRQVETHGYVTDIVADSAIDWLEHRDASRPFLLMCHNKAPHRDWEPALRDLDWDRGRVYPQPETLFDDYSGRGEAERSQDMMISKTMNDRDLKLVVPTDLDPGQRSVWNAYYRPRNELFYRSNLSGQNLVRWKYQRYIHDYLGTVRAVDDAVGRLLRYLDGHGLAGNTIVVYSSDQGFFLGEHGWFDKRWIFEESLRAPLLVRWPGVVAPGSSSDRIVSNLDFGETFLDAAGLPPDPAMQGRSLVPLLRGATPRDWRTAFYYHYYEYPAWHHVLPHYGIITDRYKLVHFYYNADYWELFDLKKDPRELLSLYGRSDYADVQRELVGELADLRRELKEPEKDAPGATGDKWFYENGSPD